MLQRATRPSIQEYINILLLIIGLFLLNKIIYSIYIFNLNLTGGNNIYPMDDAYIHLSIAKNFALYGNWGVMPNEFCSTSSSPIYTLLVSLCIKLFGDSAIYPVIINTIFANLTVILLFMFFRKQPIAFIFGCIFLFCPVLLHVQVINGMEHNLQIFLILLAFISFYKMTKTDFTSLKYKNIFLLTTLFLCLTRFESMFFLSGAIFILILLKQYKVAIWTLIIGFSPIILFGFFSIYNGGYFFPNSLLIKGSIDSSNGVISLIMLYYFKIKYNLFYVLFSIPIGLICLILLIDIIIKFKNKDFNFSKYLKEYSFVIIAFITIILHTMFASFGWLFRYEAYLLALLYISLIFVTIKSIGSFKKIYNFNNIASICIATCVLSLFTLSIIKHLNFRYNRSNEEITQGSKNIYDQQIQMSLFLKKYYNQSGVMANDIGAICYFTQTDLLDLVGLGSNSILKIKRQNHTEFNYTQNSLAQYSFLTKPEYNKYKIIIIYDSWFNIKSPSDYKQLNWTKVGELTISNNVICGSDKVSFYTSDLNMVDGLKRDLNLFKNEVPEDVTIEVF